MSNNDLPFEISTDPKSYFKNDFIADDIPRQLNTDLVKEILSLKPKSVFEFGAGQGKNLELIRQFSGQSVSCFGIDVNPETVKMAVAKGRPVATGDELSLEIFTRDQFDVAFTCGVLDHIIKIDNIIEHLKRIAKNVILYETQDIRSPYYYKHPYADFGFFSKAGYRYHSADGDGAYYEMWRWTKEGINITSED
jgi:ubiquinone/menaquinone biosynthesis C-methylase UbiE